MAYERAILQQLAENRLAEAKALITAHLPSGAYYLAGYVLECALKAKIAARFRANEIPDKGLINSVYTHDLTALLRLAGLESDLVDAIENNAALGEKWEVAKKWSEQARYAVWTEGDASAMIDAVEGRNGAEGLFQWLNNR